MILLDANVIVGGIDAGTRVYATCRRVLEGASAGKVPGVLVPQVLLEAFAVMTDRKRVRRPLRPDVAWRGLDELARALPLMHPPTGVLALLGDLVTGRRPTAQALFDAYLVAQMRALRIGTICTYNASGLSGYPGISAESPEAVAARFRLVP